MALPCGHDFFQVLLRRDIENQKLAIPKKFATEFGNGLSDVATLIVSARGVWLVGLERANQRIWFVVGWQRFAEHYSLTEGWFLVFRYQGNSIFNVVIYDFSCCEIEYPPVGQSIEHEEDVEGDIGGSPPSSSNGKCVDQHFKGKRSEQAKLQAQRMPPSQDSPTRKNIEFKKMFVRNIAAYTYPSDMVRDPEEHKKVMHAIRMFDLENPFFAVILESCNFDKAYMYVPNSFVKEHMRGCSEDMTLKDSNDMQWDAGCSSTTNRSLRIRGCGNFFRDNTLKSGDVCLFEQIKRKDVLKFSVLRCAEYAVMDGGKKKNQGIAGWGTLYFSKKNKEMVKSRETHKAMDAAQALKTKNNAFIVIVGSHNLLKSYVDVPAVCKDHLLGCASFINLKASGDKIWPVSCKYEPTRCTMRISTGFSTFAKDNDLKEGDVCVFEIVKSKDVELIVSIFHGSDYA